MQHRVARALGLEGGPQVAVRRGEGGRVPTSAPGQAGQLAGTECWRALGTVLKYHTDPRIRPADTCEKHRLSAAEMIAVVS